VSKEYGSYGSILHQPGLCCAGTEACQSQCCFPDVFWLCMAGILGFPYRILTCGKCPFRASWPLACGDPAIFIEFMWHTLLDPIGIKKGMYTAASEEEAKLLAAAEVGSEKKEYVWPRKESPTPVGISTMASLSNVSPYQYTGPLYTWLVKAWNESVEISKKMAKNNDPMVPKRPLEAGQQRQEANPTALVDLNSRDPDLLSADYELQLGEGVKQALDFQWGTTGISEYKEYKFAQPGNALGISVVPFVFTPGSVETKYTAVNKDGSSKVVIPPVGMWMICGGPWCSSMWLKDDVCGWGILGREADFSAVCVKNEDFVLAPDFVPYGHSPGAPHLRLRPRSAWRRRIRYSRGGLAGPLLRPLPLRRQPLLLPPARVRRVAQDPHESGRRLRDCPLLGRRTARQHGGHLRRRQGGEQGGLHPHKHQRALRERLLQ